MKRVFVAAVLIFASVINAHADHWVYNWYDTIRTNGHKRAKSISDPILKSCARKFGVPYRHLSPGYKKCMESNGYRFTSSYLVRTPHQPVEDNSSDDSSTWYDPGPAPSPTPLPDVTPEPPIILDQPAPVDIHPFCPNPIC
jgi:hypothetical protein